MINREKYTDVNDSMKAFNEYCMSNRNENGDCRTDCKCISEEPRTCYFEWLNFEETPPTITDNDLIKLSEEELEHLTSDSSHTIKLNEPDMVNHPSHYSSGNIECIDAIKESMSEEAYKGFLKGNAIKYLWRYEKKVAPKEDLNKAIWYINKLIEFLEK